MHNIISEDFDLTSAIREGVMERVGQVVEHLKRESPVSVYLSKANDLFNVRMNVRDNRKTYTSSESHRDFYIALNRAKERLLRQVDDRRKRNISKRHHSKRKFQSLPLDTEDVAV
jgi:ribosomal subunit interface protein